MSTYGELRLRVVKLFPGIDPELIDGWIWDRYQEILDKLPWQRLDSQLAFDTPGPYTQGTVSLTQGIAAIAGLGTGWSAAMSGSAIRFRQESAYFGFDRLSATNATMDRNWSSESVSGVPYVLFRNVFPLPTDVRVLRSVRVFGKDLPLERLSREDFHGIATDRSRLGTPSYWRSFMDDASGRPQIEVWPVPDRDTTFAIEYSFEAPAFGPDTSLTQLPWVRPSCMLAGVSADVLRHRGETALAGGYDARFLRLLENMVASETHRAGPLKFNLPDRYVAHRAKRMMR